MRPINSVDASPNDDEEAWNTTVHLHIY